MLGRVSACPAKLALQETEVTSTVQAPRIDPAAARQLQAKAEAIFTSAEDKFFYKVVAAQLDFERDGGQKVVAVVLHQNGRDMRAPRMGGQR